MKNKWKIAVTSNTFSKTSWLREELEKNHFTSIKYNTDNLLLHSNALLNFIRDMDGLIVGGDKITPEILAETRRLKVISKFGVGLDNIDIKACERHCISFVHTQGVNRRSVAEQTLAFMISLLRNMYVTSLELKKGKWCKDGGSQLTGKVVGIIGVGNVGKDVINLLKPFACKILVNDIINQDKYYNENSLIECSKEQIFREADLVTIHTPLTDKTRNMVTREVLSRMKKDSFLINTARGHIVNQADLKWALKNQVIFGAASDVFEIEPPLDKEFLELENLFCTPHIGGGAREAIRAMGQSAIQNLVKFFNM